VPQKKGITLARRSSGVGARTPVDRLVLEALAGLQLRLHDRGVESAKDLLDPRAVERDQDDGARRRLCEGRDRRAKGSEDGQQGQAFHGPGF